MERAAIELSVARQARPEAIEGPLHRLEPSTKIVGFVGFAVVVVSTPGRAVWAFAVYALALCFLVGLSGLGLGQLLKRALVVLPFVVLVAVFLPLYGRAGAGGYNLGGLHLSSGGLLVLWNVGAKAVLALLSVILLTATTGFQELLGGFQRLRLPQVFLLTMSFMYRYCFVFLEEVHRMRRSMASRNYRARWLWNAPVLGRMLGSLFLRSYSRGERVYAAMISRGYTGAFRLSSTGRPGIRELAFLASLFVVAVGTRVLASL
jgi:cobalt/nickel transport system permease protein